MVYYSRLLFDEIFRGVKYFKIVQFLLRVHEAPCSAKNRNDMFSKYVLFKTGHLNKRAGVRTPWTPPGSAPAEVGKISTDTAHCAVRLPQQSFVLSHVRTALAGMRYCYRPSVRSSVTRQYYIETAEANLRLSKPDDQFCHGEQLNKIIKIIISTTLRYDTRSYFDVCLKADMNQLNLPHETELKSGKEKTKK